MSKHLANDYPAVEETISGVRVYIELKNLAKRAGHYSGNYTTHRTCDKGYGMTSMDVVCFLLLNMQSLDSLLLSKHIALFKQLPYYLHPHSETGKNGRYGRQLVCRVCDTLTKMCFIFLKCEELSCRIFEMLVSMAPDRYIQQKFEGGVVFVEEFGGNPIRLFLVTRSISKFGGNLPTIFPGSFRNYYERGKVVSTTTEQSVMRIKFEDQFPNGGWLNDLLNTTIFSPPGAASSLVETFLDISTDANVQFETSGDKINVVHKKCPCFDHRRLSFDRGKKSRITWKELSDACWILATRIDQFAIVMRKHLIIGNGNEFLKELHDDMCCFSKQAIVGLANVGIHQVDNLYCNISKADNLVNLAPRGFCIDNNSSIALLNTFALKMWYIIAVQIWKPPWHLPDWKYSCWELISLHKPSLSRLWKPSWLAVAESNDVSVMNSGNQLEDKFHFKGLGILKCDSIFWVDIFRNQFSLIIQLEDKLCLKGLGMLRHQYQLVILGIRICSLICY
ncbi:uncharacterized protein LOC113278484 [Papaver somniferum]|uniref:uncharacterized protein LOC113278484 n=1 Tax=Papaver somniferum TaxID=3469 RepID=UPI000E700DCA|nr:uncharacterized protein LOC113278484 [Papaver somniferum]XP_026383091.1 uncharacterized protein LOC113278484 [Papaver somniferum]